MRRGIVRRWRGPCGRWWWSRSSSSFPSFSVGKWYFGDMFCLLYKLGVWELLGLEIDRRFYVFISNSVIVEHLLNSGWFLRLSVVHES